MENWKEIHGYDGKYLISDRGRVKRKRIDGKYILLRTYLWGRSDKVLCCALNSKTIKHSTRSIHHLVAENFIDNPKGYKWVRHKDGNRLNNNVENLEWWSKKHYPAFDFDSVFDKFLVLVRSGYSNKEISEMKGMPSVGVIIWNLNSRPDIYMEYVKARAISTINKRNISPRFGAMAI